GRDGGPGRVRVGVRGRADAGPGQGGDRGAAVQVPVPAGGVGGRGGVQQQGVLRHQRRGRQRGAGHAAADDRQRDGPGRDRQGGRADGGAVEEADLGGP